MLNEKYRQLYNRLKRSIPESHLFSDDLSTLVFGTDASFYRRIPKLVVKVHDEAEAQTVIKNCHQMKIPLTIRAAGTSLSGQAITDSVLMLIISSEWRHYEITKDGGTITLQPGVIGAQANRYLAPYKKKIGPDPASINSAQIGGIVSNNASGMTSGTLANSYHSLRGMRIIFNDGTLLDTRDPDSRRQFLEHKKDLVEQIKNLAEKTKDDKDSAEKITEKFKIKNTTGYGVNSLLDFDDPVDIIAHLMVGAEGTLGFISQVTLRTVDDPPKRAAGLVFFPDIATACASIAILRQCCVGATELMDRASLRAVENKPGMPEFLKTLDGNATALLVETRAKDEKTLQKQIKEIEDKLGETGLLQPLNFSTDLKAITALWNVRKGLFPSVCANRKKGTTVIIEDIAVPYAHLAKAIVELQSLFDKYHYNDAIIWGHAFDGNVHFVLIQNFSESSEIERYEKFIHELVSIVVDKYNGSLKAEHGTGRNMAPFVQREWGSAIYSTMREIKKIFDPENILNPGVLINDDPKLHLKDLKTMPEAHDIIDDCIECGFCEINCVSRDLTITPRQRIVAYREIASLKRSGNEPHRLAQLWEAYDYPGNQTCATDGLCALSCPVDIDTGILIKELRYDITGKGAQKIAARLANNMQLVTAAGRFGLKFVNGLHAILGSRLMLNLSALARTATFNKLPRWTPAMPSGSRKIRPVSVQSANKKKVVYFPSCITRTMGVSKDYDEQTAITEKTESLLRKAGYEIIYPDNMDQLCCGMAFASKGFRVAGQMKADELETALLKATGEGKYPVLADMSPCLYRMKETLTDKLKLYEPIAFTLKYLSDHLEWRQLDETVVIHTVCSARKMDLEEDFITLAKKCAAKVVVPETTCCGFAGDRGFTYPELNADGLKLLREQIPDDCTQGYSTSRTCEIGLTEHSGISYKSILYLVDRCTTPLTR